MAEQPNDASRKSKAEGERWSENESSGASERYENTDEQAGGITNRPLDEEISNQQALPARGDSKPGAHAGHGSPEFDGDRRSER